MPPRNMLDLVPAAYVALLAALHVWVQRRFFDPLPWRAVVVFGAALALLLGAALAGGRTLLPLDGLRGQAPFRELPPTVPHGNPLHGDLLQLIAPLQSAVREALAAGEWPLWNARAGAGMPLLANPQAQAFQPLALAAAPLGLFAAPGVAAALRVWVALAGMLLFLRRQGLGEGASTFGALAYGLGGFLLLWLGWPLANAAAWLPLLLYAIQLADERGARRDAALLLAAAFAVVTGGQPESVVYALAVAAAFLAARLAARPPERRLGLAVRAGGALLLAGMLAAPLLLPTLEYLPHTLRATDRRAAAAAPAVDGDERRAPWQERAVERLLPIAAPNAFGNGRFGDPSGAVYWGESNINEDASGFAGTLALLATGAGLAARRRLGQERLAWLLLVAGAPRPRAAAGRRPRARAPAPLVALGDRPPPHSDGRRLRPGVARGLRRRARAAGRAALAARSPGGRGARGAPPLGLPRPRASGASRLARRAAPRLAAAPAQGAGGRRRRARPGADFAADPGAPGAGRRGRALDRARAGPSRGAGAAGTSRAAPHRIPARPARRGAHRGPGRGLPRQPAGALRARRRAGLRPRRAGALCAAHRAAPRPQGRPARVPIGGSSALRRRSACATS